MTKLNLSPTQFQINGTPFDFPIDVAHLKSALNHGVRLNETKNNQIYTWDELGILAYSKDGKAIETLYLCYMHEKFDFSPKHLFTGSFLFDGDDILHYYKNNKDKRIKLFDGDVTGAVVLNDIYAWFADDFDSQSKISGIEIGRYQEVAKEEVPEDKYLIKALDEETLQFVDFGFKLSIIQELMYRKELLAPKFELYEFAAWYKEREIDIEAEGYDPIPEVTQYFKDLPIPKRLAAEITEIYQDGGNEIYLNLLRFGEGWEDYWDMETAEDAKLFPNLTKATLCYAKENVLDELKNMGIQAKYL